MALASIEIRRRARLVHGIIAPRKLAKTVSAA